VKKKILTSLQRNFVNNYVLDPRSATRAAERAGYSPRSAAVIASRLLRDPVIQSELARHFVDKEALLADILNDALTQLKDLINNGEPRDRIKAIKQAIDYTKLANSVLGLEVKRLPKPEEAIEALTPEQLRAKLQAEIERLDRMAINDEPRAVSGDDSQAEEEAGTGEIQH